MKTSGNPTLNQKAFRVPVMAGQEVMTERGTYIKTAVLLALCVWTASMTWGPAGQAFIWPGVIGGFIFALITIFKKEWSMVTAPLYALCEGVALGAISYMYQAQYAGIVVNAVMLTFSVMVIMLAVYSFEIIKVTDRLRSCIVVATGAIMLVYLVGFVMSFFGTSIPMIHGSGMVGIGFSLVVVGIASFNLLLDFDFIERAASSGSSPKYMEWYGAFGLVVTLVWLYLEILRLLSKLNRR